ncbi:hypothetical protein [Micromonospora coxensis]|uniref:Uncharacterized protein n=1 Tax=Micromonospora coxensis TaxID=356852 RepID=A0A1C5JXR1_9ACTN|nr:hypothetical protein [Micromonospora coxensis]SCG75362.1 hypothetical protein GA0070614_5656 [Micromonospora coxensis]
MPHPDDVDQHEQPDDPCGHVLWPWLLLALALPGVAWSAYDAAIAAAPSFGEPPSPQDQATSAAALLSGASLCLTTALLTATVCRRVPATVGCLVAAAGYATLALTGPGRQAPLGAADQAGWVAAWTPPTSWLVGAGLVAVALRAASVRAVRRPVAGAT